MAIIKTIVEILNLLIPIVWGISYRLYSKRRWQYTGGKFEIFVFSLTLLIFCIGMVSHISAGLNLFGLE